MSNVNSILSIHNLTVAFGSGKFFSRALSDVSFDVIKGQCVGLVGESGSGKTLTGLSILQLLPHAAYIDEKSKIFFEGKDILTFSERSMRNIRGKEIALIFQDAMSAFNPVFTIGNQLLETYQKHFKTSHSLAKKKIYSLLEEVGLSDFKRYYRAYPHELSGGQRQRAMIAMALSGDPKILIADEPTTAVDVTIQAQIISLLKTLKNSRQMTLLFISHDLSLVSEIADEIVVLEKGIKIEESPASQFFKSPQEEYSKKLLASIPPNRSRDLIPPQKNELLTVENLRVYFPIQSSFLRRTIDYVKAVDDISFTISCGETLALVGESGSGKTTTGKAILKLLNITSGNIFFDNENIASLSKNSMKKFRENIQIIFQDPRTALNPRIMIGDSIAEGMIAQKLVKSRKEALSRVDNLLKQVELSPEMKWRYPHEFSGGQRQRICIARALALSPKLLVLDEPTSSLDVSIQMQILQLLEKLQKEYLFSYLLITHNISIVAHMAHQIAVMRHGKIIEYGKTSTILENPKQEYTKKLLASVPLNQFQKE